MSQKILEFDDICNTCGLFNGTTRPKIKGLGPSNAKVVIVGEAPGKYEEKEGLPFVGPSGTKLNDYLKIARLSRDEVYITNACKCFPASPLNKPMAPKKFQIDCCRKFLVEELNRLKPDLIITLGNAALYSVLPNIVDRPAGITKHQGRVIYSEEFGCDVIPVLHPSAILRRPELESSALADWATIGACFHDEKEEPIPENYIVLDNIDLVREFFTSILPRVDMYSFDTETRDLNWKTADLVSVQWSWKKGSAIVLPMYVHGEKWWRDDRDEVYELLRGEFVDRPAKRIAHNMKFDTKVLRTVLGGEVCGQYFDTMIAAHLLNENQPLNLTHVGRIYGGMPPYDYALDEYWNSMGIKSSKRDYRTLPANLVIPYAAKDADCTWRSYLRLYNELRDDNDLWVLFNTLLMPLQQAIADTEFHGITVDKGKLDELRDLLTDDIAKSLDEIYNHAGGEINPNSSQQLSNLLYDRLELPVLFKTPKGAPSTDANTLEALKDMHPVINSILTLRKSSKLKSTFIDGISDVVAMDGRVHTTYNITGTKTGRLSSSDPNLQNIPRPDEDNRSVIRTLFVPSSPDRRFMKVDYAQAEFRVWGYVSGEQKIFDEIAAGRDIHRSAAAVAFGVDVADVTKEQRTQAKMVVYGLMYGRGTASVAKQLGIDEAAALAIMDWFSSQYPRAWGWLKDMRRYVLRYGYVTSPLGRKRRFPEVTVSGFSKDESASAGQIIRQGVNAPIQATASDITSAAFVRLHRRIRKDNLPAQLLLIIHDEFDLEYDLDFEDRMIEIVKEEALHPIPKLAFPLEIEITISDRWAGNIIHQETCS